MTKSYHVNSRSLRDPVVVAVDTFEGSGHSPTRRHAPLTLWLPSSVCVIESIFEA